MSFFFSKNFTPMNCLFFPYLHSLANPWLKQTKMVDIHFLTESIYMIIQSKNQTM